MTSRPAPGCPATAPSACDHDSCARNSTTSRPNTGDTVTLYVRNAGTVDDQPQLRPTLIGTGDLFGCTRASNASAAGSSYSDPVLAPGEQASFTVTVTGAIWVGSEYLGLDGAVRRFQVTPVNPDSRRIEQLKPGWCRRWTTAPPGSSSLHSSPDCETTMRLIRLLGNLALWIGALLGVVAGGVWARRASWAGSSR